MTRRRIIVGLCMLCALLVSAFAAQSASAITGTTAFTCSTSASTKDRDGAHCLDTATANSHGHVAIAQDKTTELITTNSNTANNTTEPTTGILKVTIAGIPLELAATGAGASGWMENKVNAVTGEHYSHGKGTTTFTGVEVKAPAGRGCKVTTHKEDGSGSPLEEGEVGVIHTRELTATTEGAGENLNFKAADGGNFANFWVTCEEGKKIPAIEGTWSCSGSFKAQPEGVTTNFTHATVTTENKLKCKGSKAGIEFKTTGSGREKGSTGAYTPISTTTVAT